MRSDGKVVEPHAFDQATGEIRWETKRPETSFAHTTPVIVKIGDRAEMLVSASNAIQGLDPTNGQLLWWCAAAGGVALGAALEAVKHAGRAGGRQLEDDPQLIGPPFAVP